MLCLRKQWTDRAPDALVNGVNLRALASSKLVHEATALNPSCEQALDLAVRKRELVAGLVFPLATQVEAPRLILLVVTRMDHRTEPCLADLELAVASLRAFLLEQLLRTVAVAAFAEGHPKTEVLKVLQRALGDLETEVLVAEN